MGFLIDATPLTWEESLPYLAYIREHGIQQFISTYNKVKARKNDVLLWGDEIEYHVLKLDHANRTARVSLRADTIIAKLAADEAVLKAAGQSLTSWHPEYGNWMVEATPSHPYGGYASDLCSVSDNMVARRRRIETALDDDEVALTIVAFPMFGVGDFTFPSTTPGGASAASDCVSDLVINPHPRFGTLTGNIRRRRGSKVDIKVPLFRDKYTFGRSDKTKDTDEVAGVLEMPAQEQPLDSSVAIRQEVGHVTMDCMAFGMGCCCLQVTFQARDLEESLRLYDQLAVLTPIFMALGAACPILKGRVVDTDVRWNVIAGSVDDRTPAERGVGDSRGGTVAGNGARPIRKSRYDSIDSYISDNTYFKEKYNDLPIELDEPSLATLTAAGVPLLLARHLAHLWIRDPLVIYKERVEIDDAKEVDHFENIQSTNWQSVRWKPPPPAEDGEGIGWRVEFRSTEVQLTEFENAAFSVLIALVSRVILFFDLNMYMPLSKVDENMRRAHVRQAVTTELFFFRKHVIPLAEECGTRADGESYSEDEEDACAPMTIAEILMGKNFEASIAQFPGLFPLIYAYLDIIECAPDIRLRIETYCEFLYMRATGELLTTATWMRQFVRSHPAYQNDSVVTQDIAYDLMVRCSEVVKGQHQAPELFGKFAAHVGTNTQEKEAEAPSTAKATDAGDTKAARPLRLRGASFRVEVKTGWQCNLINALIEKYSSRLKGHTLQQEKGAFQNATPYLFPATASPKPADGAKRESE